MKEREKIVAIILGIIIIAGLVVTFVFGLNFGQQYKTKTQIKAYLATDVNISSVKSIVNEVFTGQNTSIQKVEMFNDEVAINVESTTDEQMNALAEKLGQAYSLDLSTDDLETMTLPGQNISNDIIPYLLPVGIAFVIILIYMAIRYRKLGATKVVLSTLALMIIGELLLLSVFAVCRIVVNSYTLPLALVVLLVVLTLTTLKFEKEM